MSRKHLSANNLAIYGGVVLGVLGGVHYLIHRNIKVPVKADDVQKLSDMNVPHETIYNIQNSKKSDNVDTIDPTPIAPIDPTPIDPTPTRRKSSVKDPTPTRRKSSAKESSDIVDAIDPKHKFAMNNQDIKYVNPPPSPTDDLDLSDLQRLTDELDPDPDALPIEEEKTEILRKASKKKKKVKTPFGCIY